MMASRLLTIVTCLDSCHYCENCFQTASPRNSVQYESMPAANGGVVTLQDLEEGQEEGGNRSLLQKLSKSSGRLSPPPPPLTKTEIDQLSSSGKTI